MAIILEIRMSKSKLEELKKQLKHHLGEKAPANAALDINAALEVAKILETRGFSFQLKDLCPKSLSETQWQATFSKDGLEFSADDPQSPMAVCMAAVGALTT